MKIVCQSCSATYKIADDKVQGKKVFKIKCKKCGEDILVRGTDAPAEQPEAQERHADDESTRLVSTEGGAGAAGDGVWHAVLNGEQQGPYTIDQLREMMAQGSIDTETYVWRDGFDGWAPMREVAELSALLVPAEAPAAAPAGGGDLFAAASSATTSANERNARAAEPAKARTVPKGGDLFAPEAREQETAKPLFAPEEPKAPAGDHLTGQRNENSVLFSLATLQQLSGKESAPAASNNPDASGLIDINKLAGALGNTGGGKKSSVDDILSVGSSAGLSSPLAAPVLAPVPMPSAPVVMAAEPAKPQGLNKTVLFTGVAVAVILVGGGGLMMALNNRNRGDETPPTMAANTAPMPAATNNSGPPTSPTPSMPETNAAPSPTPAAPPAAAPANEPAGRDRPRDRTHDRPSTAAPAAAAPAAAHAPTAPTAPTTPARAAPARTGSIDDLMNQVGSGSRPAGGNSAAAAPAAGAVPETPDRGTVGAALRGLSSSVRACGTGAGGTAMVTIVFANTGHVTTANVNGIPPGPAVGCIVTAVRRASLPPFGRPTFSVTYPYPLN